MLINKYARRKKFKFGIRRLKMEIERDLSIKINLKRIARIKKIYEIPTVIRKKSKIAHQEMMMLIVYQGNYFAYNLL